MISLGTKICYVALLDENKFLIDFQPLLVPIRIDGTMEVEDWTFKITIKTKNAQMLKAASQTEV